MSITKAQARRAVGRAEFEWDDAVKDPRSERNQRHGHRGLLSLMAASFACGRVVLRRVEDFCEDLGVGARRRLGIPKAVSDSTLYRLVEKQKPAGFRETIWKQLRRLIELKLIKRELFRFGVMSFDGKSVWTSTKRTIEGAKQAVDDKSGVVTSSLSTLRAVLTSALGQPCVDLQLIAAKTGESPAFRDVFRRVCDNFGQHFEIVTSDAAMTGRENALVIRGGGKHYLLALKGNQPTLHGFAERWFAMHPGSCLKETSDWEHGALMTRQLHVVSVTGLDGFDFYGATEVWRVRQTSIDVSGKTTEEVRYFISSMPSGMLTPSEKLTLVRLHWGIENGHHWALDVALEEDDVQPVQRGRDAIEVIAWLRVLGYNLVAMWRAQGPRKDGRPLSWARVMENLRDALVLGTKEPVVPLA